jgi:anti-anti-sigma factor
MDIEIEDRDGHVIIRPSGSIVRENQADLKAFVEKAIAGKVRGVAFDFDKVDYLDSAGLGCCVGIHKLLFDKKSGRLVVFGAMPAVEQVWRMIRLDLIIPLLRDEKDAIEKLKEDDHPLL